MNAYTKTVCGLEITFHTSADAERVDNATSFIQQKFDSLQAHGSQIQREKLLLVLLIGITDDLLQIQKKQDEMLEVVDKKNQQDKTTEAQLTLMLEMINSLKNN